MHRTYPEIFSSDHLTQRELIYGAALSEAAAVVTGSVASARHIVDEYAVDPVRLATVHYGPGHSSISLEGPVAELPARVAGMVDGFVFFPALTYAHKNHIRLLEALAQLRDDGLRVPLVCTGALKLHWPVVRSAMERLGLEDQVMFLGFVDEDTVRALYRSARLVVFPSLFEGAGLPVIEALSAGAPVACSNIAPLREYGGEVPLYFDPLSVNDIATATRRLWLDKPSQDRQRAEGPQRAKQFTWLHVAEVYRSLYRRSAGRELTDRDQELLCQATALSGKTDE